MLATSLLTPAFGWFLQVIVWKHHDKDSDPRGYEVMKKDQQTCMVDAYQDYNKLDKKQYRHIKISCCYSYENRCESVIDVYP